jgi:hypothetical protein
MPTSTLPALDGLAAVPLIEQLRSVLSSAVLRIDTPNTLGVDTRNIPVGRLCHEAAESLEAALAVPAQWIDIASAPKDGTVIFGFWRPLVGVSTDHRNYGFAHFVGTGWRLIVGDGWDTCLPPTNWQALPAPPGTAEPAKQGDAYIGGPYPDGGYAICELSTGRVLQRLSADDFPESLRAGAAAPALEERELPPLPEPERFVTEQFMGGPDAQVGYFAAEQMREYARAAIAAKEPK